MLVASWCAFCITCHSYIMASTTTTTTMTMVACAHLRAHVLSTNSHISNQIEVPAEILLLFAFVIFLIGTFIVLSRVIFLKPFLCHLNRSTVHDWIFIFNWLQICRRFIFSRFFWWTVKSITHSVNHASQFATTCAHYLVCVCVCANSAHMQKLKEKKWKNAI